jgi:uracil-DNA glycosylase
VSPDSKTYNMTASIKEYLLGLQESGVDGIPERNGDSGPGVGDQKSHTNQFESELSQVKKEPVAAPVAAGTPQADAAAPRYESLDKINKDLGDCQLCQLGKTRKKPVFGVGNSQARIVFIGEWPGADEEQKGEPFAGESGQVLNRIITAMGLKREEVYICNVVKCCPPGNRDPQKEEIEACLPFLQRQLQSVKPEVIVTLGKISTQTLLGHKEPISRLRGKFHDYKGIPLMPTHHPSDLASNTGDKGLFWDVWDDMVQVLQFLKLPVPDKSRKR